MNLTSCKNPAVYDELNKLVFEYLDINGLQKTLESFTFECTQKALPCPSLSDNLETKIAFSQHEAAKLMEAFDDGNLEKFFQIWRGFLSHIQVTSDDMAKLEVYIRVHFALWPRARSKSIEVQEKAMNELKLFFEQEKSSLGKDAAILPLYALPFVEDPYNHPIFKELFKDVWTMKLRAQLESTVIKYFELLQENICQHSRLAELVIKGERYEEKKVVHRDSEQNDRFYQLLGSHRKTRKLLQGARESYAKLLLVTHELLMSLEETSRGQPSASSINLEAVLDKCFYIFPEIFTPKDGSETGKPDVEYFKQISASANFDPTQDSEISVFFLGIKNVGPEFLNFVKIKDTLVNDVAVSISEKLCLLQALRWLYECKQTAVDAFVSNDLLGIKDKNQDFRQKLFNCLFFPTPTYQKECLSRLVNAISSTKTGRNYLSSTTFVVEALVKSLQTFTGSPTESFICQMVVATLQKLSLKKKMRHFMIDYKVVDWLVVFITKTLSEQDCKDSDENENSISDVGNFNPYLLEYVWALLMNLCLHEESWKSCVDNGKDLLQSACKMLQITPRKDLALAPYIISTLYSLLRCPDLYALAKAIQLENMVASILIEDSDLSDHLNNLFTLLYSSGCDRISSSRETNYDDEDNSDPDVFEPEIELAESWTTSLDESELTGDYLLVKKYLSYCNSDPVVSPSFHATDSSKPIKIAASKNIGEFTRPITPSAISDSIKVKKTCQKKAVKSKAVVRPRTGSKEAVSTKEVESANRISTTLTESSPQKKAVKNASKKVSSSNAVKNEHWEPPAKGKGVGKAMNLV